MQKYSNNIQDQFGNWITGLTVEVRNHVGGALAGIFSDDGVTPKANPFVEASSEFLFYAANGRYDIFFSGTQVDDDLDNLLFDSASFVGFDPASDQVITGQWQFNLPIYMRAAIASPNLGGIGQIYSGSGNNLFFRDSAGTDFDLLAAGGPAAGTVTNSTLRWSGAAWVENTSIQNRTNGRLDLVGSPALLRLDAPGAAANETTTDIRMENFSGFVIQAITDGGSNSNFLMNANRTGVVWQELQVQTNLAIFDTAGGQITVRTDINTATPPTNEAVTGNFYIRDLAGNDDLMRLGFAGSNLLLLDAYMRGALFLHRGVNTAGVTQNMFSADPDFGFTAYWQNTTSLQTVDFNGSGMAGGAQMKNTVGGWANIGMAEAVNLDAGGVLGNIFSQINIGRSINVTSVGTFTTYTNVEALQLVIPDGTYWPVENDSGSPLALNAGAGVVLEWMSGAGGPTTGNRTLADGGAGVMRKVNDSKYRWVGNGTT
jgi:hypothetical protein